MSEMKLSVIMAGILAATATAINPVLPHRRAPAQSSGPWLDDSYSYRISITIDSSLITGTLTDYPLYIDLDDMPDSYHSAVQSDGDDTRASDATHTTSHPIELVVIDTTAKTGEVHVLVPSVSASVDTTIFLYYGSAGASASTTAADVWVNYMGVWHMQASGGSAQPSSTGESAIDADPTSMSSSNNSTGIAGGAIEYDGTADYHTIPQTDATTHLTPDLTHSMSVWFRPDDAANQNIVQNRVNGTTGGIGAWIWSGYVKASMGNQYGYWNELHLPTSAYLSVNEWNYFHSTFVSGSLGWLRLGNAANGLLQDLYAGSASAHNFDTDPLYFGRRPSAGDYFDGDLDEIRITDANTSDAWHKACYANFIDATTFYTIGTQETK